MLPSPPLTVGDAGGGDGGGGVGVGIADGGVTVTAADLTSHLHARFPKAEAVDLRAHHLVGEQLESLSAGQLEVRAQKCGCVRLCAWTPIADACLACQVLQEVLMQSIEGVVDARVALGIKARTVGR